MYSKRSGIRKKAVKGGFLPFMAPMMGAMGASNPFKMLMGKGVVHPQYQYAGSGVVHPQYQYAGSGMSGGMDAATFFNPMTSPLSPLSWAKSMFGGGMVGGKKKRSSARGQKIAHLMRSQGMTLGQASKHLKNIGE